MTTPLHAALGRTGTELTFELIEATCEQKVAETDRLDWKRDLPLPLGKAQKDQETLVRTLELAKDLAAMANSRGGILIYGINEKPKDIADSIEGVELEEAKQQIGRIRQVAYNFIYPPVQLDCTILSADDATSHVLAVEISESDEAPHLVQPKRDGGNDGWLQAPYRSGPDTLNMVEKQLEAAYRQRIDGRRQRQRRLNELHDELIRRHVPTAAQDTGTLVAIAQPANPRRGPLPGSFASHTAQAVVQGAVGLATWTVTALARGSIAPNTVLLGQLGGIDSPRRGLRRFVLTKSRHIKGGQGQAIGRPAEVAAEVHDDGTIGLVWRRGALYPSVQQTEEKPPSPSLASNDVDIFAITFIALVLKAYEDLDVNADYQVRVAIIPEAPLHLLRDDGEVQGEPVLPPPPFETELRLSGSPDTRAADVLSFGKDLNTFIERSQTILDGFWNVPRGSMTDQATFDLAQRLFGGHPDHPTEHRPMK